MKVFGRSMIRAQENNSLASQLPTKICLVCMDRTGSNMISARLNTHQNICFYNEIFHREFVIFQDERIVGDYNLMSMRDRDPAAFVAQVWAGDYEAPENRKKLKAIGFKLFLNHDAEALRYVTQSDAKIIFLRRRNPLSRYSSFKIASTTGEWKSLARPSRATTTRFDGPEFRAYVQNYLNLEMLYEMTLNRWNRPYLNVWYEDIARMPQVWADLVAYLGFDDIGFGPAPIVKQNSTDVLARFSNRDEVERFVAASGDRDWLIDV